MVFEQLMRDFKVLHLIFVCEALGDIRFDAQPGTAIRGAMYAALIEAFSPEKPIQGLPQDPVRDLLAAENPDNARGRDIPRAFTVVPPAAHSEVKARGRFSFGVSLFGSAIDLMPYLIRAVGEMGKMGLGKGRGQFRFVRLLEMNPLNGQQNILLEGKEFQAPNLVLVHPDFLKEAESRSAEEISINFLTPMRLIVKGALLHEPRLGVLLRRLLERAQSLVEHYGSAPVQKELWQSTWQRLGELGDALDESALLRHNCRWVNIESFSKARGRSSPIGGFIGQASWRIDSPEILLCLLWGQSLHVGKDAAKGNGYFRLE
jgi:hypothetical protein